MKPSEILMIDAKRNPQGLDANGLAGLIMSSKENNGASVIQEGNTLMMYFPINETHAEFHCFNADTPENLVKNVSKLYVVLKKDFLYPQGRNLNTRFAQNSGVQM